jgi:hypothetical protein
MLAKPGVFLSSQGKKKGRKYYIQDQSLWLKGHIDDDTTLKRMPVKEDVLYGAHFKCVEQESWPNIYGCTWATAATGLCPVQVISEDMGDAYLRLKLKDQQNAIAMIESDPELKGLRRSTGPFLDLEVRGLPALRYFGDIVWRGPEGSGPLSEFSSGARPSGWLSDCVS